MKGLTFTSDGVCKITLGGIPAVEEIESLVEEYVTGVEANPRPMHLIYIDISKLVHMAALQRQIFSDLIIEASGHYDNVELIIAGGSLNLRRFLELFCKGIGLRGSSHIFADVVQANAWIERWLENIALLDREFSAREA